MTRRGPRKREKENIRSNIGSVEAWVRAGDPSLSGDRRKPASLRYFRRQKGKNRGAPTKVDRCTVELAPATTRVTIRGEHEKAKKKIEKTGEKKQSNVVGAK